MQRNGSITPAQAPLDVDNVVAAVLRRLAERTDSQVPARIATAERTPSSASTLLIAPRVVTLSALPSSLAEFREAVVASGAIVTPAARDRLREAGLTLRYGDATRADAVGPAGSRLVVGVVAGEHDAADVRRHIQDRGLACTLLPPCDLTSVVGELVEAVSHNGVRGLLLTRQVAAAVCLANRHRGIRAASASSVDEVNALLREIGLNLLILRPGAQSPHTLRWMIDRFAASSVTCPETLRNALA